MDRLLQPFRLQDPGHAVAIDEHPFPTAKGRQDLTVAEAGMVEGDPPHAVPGSGFIGMKTPVGSRAWLVVEGGSGQVEAMRQRGRAHLSLVREVLHELPPSLFPNGRPSRVSWRRSLIRAYSATSFFRRAFSCRRAVSAPPGVVFAPASSRRAPWPSSRRRRWS